MSNSKFVRWIFILYLFLLCLFVYSNLNVIVLKEISILPQLTQVLVFIIAICLILFSKVKSNNNFYKLFVAWFFCYIFLYIVTPQYNVGDIGIFRVTWFINSFIISFICSQKIKGAEKLLLVACYLLLLINSYFVYCNIFTGVSVLNIQDFGVSNIVFWSFCLFPLVFLIDNTLYKNIGIAIISIICLFTMKRSAFISLVVILFFDFIRPKKTKKQINKKRKYIYIIISIVCVFILFYKFQDQFIEIINRNLDRINSIEEDRGSNRLTVWDDVLNAFNRNTLLEWIFGNGMGSTWVKARHTTAHNDFLTVFFEFGFIGVAFYLMFIYNLIRKALTEWNKQSEYVMPIISTLVILLIIGNVGDMFTCYTYLSYLTCLLGFIEGRKFYNSK